MSLHNDTTTRQFFPGSKPNVSRREKKDRDWEERQKRMGRTRQEEAAVDRKRVHRLGLAYERGRLECIALCAKFHAALSQELRDMVYDHLITPGVLHHVLEARDENGNLRVSNNPLVSMSFFDPRSRIPAEPAVRRDVWRYSEYTGDVVGKEIAERWYRIGNFILYAEDDLFNRFLSMDVWERGVIPADAVRHVRLVIPDHLTHKADRSQAIRNVRLLARFSNKQTHISIELSRLGGSQNAVMARGHIYSTVYQLRESGYRKVDVHDCFAPPNLQDSTHLFDDFA